MAIDWFDHRDLNIKDATMPDDGIEIAELNLAAMNFGVIGNMEGKKHWCADPEVNLLNEYKRYSYRLTLSQCDHFSFQIPEPEH
ncbi:hypothetical protein [Pedobacter sp. AJM]|uniref:hypothetical protein n=1 Tax=Pedobacter sp. AJM TaxID=2003629 RepID=UPI000B4BBD60|nr:hypothetical protein [Pedobacter sp. AJM]OWK68832.1 hypothetical protein CBW18_20395 [Pedobacter sp. AJM]